jgi:hypothetical protein
MSNRVVVNVATAHPTNYRRGQMRLRAKLDELGELYLLWREVPSMCPPHSEVPYAFKAYALQTAAAAGHHSLLWVDASMLPIRPLDSIWEKIERDGYLLMNNGFINYEWTADSAYPDLFAREMFPGIDAMLKGLHPEAARRIVERAFPPPKITIDEARSLNRTIPHLVGGIIGLDLTKEVGRDFLSEYFRLASETRAFCGPWGNTNSPGCPDTGILPRGPCGPPDVKGHRHDQTAASVVAWRLGMKLTDSPEFFSGTRQKPGGGASLNPADYDPRTVLVDYGTD